MAEPKRVVNPNLLPHPRPCWCVDCRREYGKLWQRDNADRYKVNYLHSCIICGERFTSLTPTSSHCSGKCRADSVVRIAFCSESGCSRSFEKKGTRTRCDMHFIGAGSKYKKKQREWVSCTWCLRPFERIVNRRTRVCCDEHCLRKLKNHILRHGRAGICYLPMCVVCDEPTLKGPKSLFCEKHKRRAGEEARLASGANNLKNARRRSATHDGDPGITVAKLRDRDGDFCRACGFKIDFDAPQYDDLAPEIDHIVPLAREGTHTWDNVQLLHGRCNRAKGARLIPDRPTLFEEDIA